MSDYIDLVKTRLDTCNACEFKESGVVDTCSVCGCVIKIKMVLPETECPKGKWSIQ